MFLANAKHTAKGLTFAAQKLLLESGSLPLGLVLPTMVPPVEGYCHTSSLESQPKNCTAFELLLCGIWSNAGMHWLQKREDNMDICTMLHRKCVCMLDPQKTLPCPAEDSYTGLHVNKPRVVIADSSCHQQPLAWAVAVKPSWKTTSCAWAGVSNMTPQTKLAKQSHTMSARHVRRPFLSSQGRRMES